MRFSKEGHYQIKIICSNCGDCYQDDVPIGERRPPKWKCRTCGSMAKTYTTSAQ
jgi:hypothetical protein